MISSLLTGLAAACLCASLPGNVAQEAWEKTAYEVRREVYNPYEPHGIYEDMRIVYQAGDSWVLLEAEDVIDWVRYWPDGHWDIDDEKIADFIAGLCQRFDTWDNYKILETTPGIGIPSRKIQVAAGAYGWRVDRQTETQEISEMLRTNQTNLHELHFSSEAAEWGEPYEDYGDSYIEIDLTRQRLWLYLDGKRELSSDIVSGLMNTDRQTPGGAYAIYYKQSPAVLTGPDYSSPVSYWMPFNGGIGLHDATWQSSFGGDACYYRGSHGCINLPLDVAGQIYEMVETGFPVLCYY